MARSYFYLFSLLALLGCPALAAPLPHPAAAPLAVLTTAVAQNVTVQLGADGTATLAAASVNNGSTGTGAITYTIRKVAYGLVAENATLTLTAPTGAVFSTIVYASYGTSTGTNGNYAVGGCNGTNSASVVGTYLLNKNSGSIPATNGVFTDPCVNTLKNLAVVATYSAATATQTYTCADVTGPNYVLLTATDSGGNTSTATAQVTVLASPTATLTAASPSTGTVGNTITLSGTNLSGATGIKVNGTAATIASASASALTSQVPAGATSGSIVVALPCSQSLSTPFTVSADLVISTPGQVIQSGIYNTITINSPGSATLGSNVVVNTGITVSNGATLNDNCNVLTGAGSFTLAAGGTLGICNSAGISASGATGAVQTTGTRSFNTDALYTYNGTVAQATGNGLPATVRTLALTNSAGLTLTSALTATVAATITSGVLATGDRVLTLGSSATISETATGFVTGTVQTTRTLSTAGTTETFGGLGVTLTPSGSILPGSTTVRRVTGTALSGIGSSRSVKRSFNIQPAVNVGLNVALTLTARDDERNGIAPANLRLYKSNDAGTTWQPQAGATYNSATANGLTTYSASLNNVQSLGLLTLGDATGPLPVQLVTFTAEAVGSGARLRWHTASELDNDRFEVEASADGHTFGRVGTVAGHGTTPLPQQYAFTDENLARYATALVYYRLRQVDGSGTATYSAVRTVVVAAATSQPLLTVYPTTLAAGQALSYLYTGPAPAADTVLELYNAAGKRVAGQALDNLAGTLPVAELASGWYWVRVAGTAARFFRP